MIYVTHDQSEAMALATDVAVMSEGKLLQMAPPLEIYARPEGRIVGGLVGQGAILRLAVVEDERQLDWQMLREPLYAGTGGPADVDILVRPQDVLLEPGAVGAGVISSLLEGGAHAVPLLPPAGQLLRPFS